MLNNIVGMRQRALAAMHGERLYPLPMITRLETWYKSHVRSGSLPAHLRGLSLDEVHAAVGVGRLKFSAPFAFRLHKVEVQAIFNGDPLYQDYEPVIENIPGMWDIVPTDRAGLTVTRLITPRGALTLQHTLLPEHVLTATDPYLKLHLVQGEEDYPVVEFILENAEFVPLFDKIYSEQVEIGDDGLVVPLLYRIPFQQVLLEYLGEIDLFYALHDHPTSVRRLLDLLDQQTMEIIHQLRALDVPYVEFPDNLHGLMTNPRLFQEYCLPGYQKYCSVLQAQGKKVGSHTDGNLRPLLGLLAQSGLDVCESFSPFPLTECLFEEAWQAWERGPLIWGAIPSPILEESFSEADFHRYLEHLLEQIDRPIILGIVDLCMRQNSIERVEYFARKVQNQPV
ncbi:MAG: hypothetical protein A2W33_01095 [Chloroflexi bacterium RBG_16_52_11]|nr:MAG: hypothetical protein A2W33_01095 [Chloroflexi bacterium RBG_16_52_11]